MDCVHPITPITYFDFPEEVIHSLNFSHLLELQTDERDICCTLMSS